MDGVITTRHLLTHARTIIREFGLGSYLRGLRAALSARRPVTFLHCVLAPRGALRRPSSGLAGTTL